MDEKNVVLDYTRPEVKDYGTLRELTAASVTGTHTDVPIGTSGGPGSPVFS